VLSIPGAEDITIDPGSGLAFISSYDRMLYKAGLPSPGTIFTLDFNDPHAVPQDITVNPKLEFHPHGISLYQDPNGKTYLFAINHNQKGNFVEIYDYHNGQLKHVETVSHALMHEPNDLVAVGPRQFYISNNHGSTSSLGKNLERFIPLSRSYVLYYDGKDMTIAAKDIGAANGMAISPDGKTIYVAATEGKSIHRYNRDSGTGALNLDDILPVDGFPDNIEMDNEGSLFVAVLPKALTYLAHRKNPDNPAPTVIVKISFNKDDRYTIEEVYADDGTNINAATVAAPFTGGMILGPSRDKRHHILICYNK
jgi:arylesterase/paraoxonase